MIFSGIPHWTIFCLRGLVVDGTVDGEDIKEEKTREVADSKMYHIRRNFHFLGCDIVSCCGFSGFYQSFSTFNMSDHTLSTWKLVVDDTEGSKKNLEGKTREVADIRGCPYIT